MCAGCKKKKDEEQVTILLPRPVVVSNMLWHFVGSTVGVEGVERIGIHQKKKREEKEENQIGGKREFCCLG